MRASGFGLSALDVDQGGVADHVEHRGERAARARGAAPGRLLRPFRPFRLFGPFRLLRPLHVRRNPHPQPPATAGRMEISAPSATGVSKPSK